MADETLMEKVKGTAKEMAGKLTGRDDLAKEGEAQQKKAQKAQEAERLEQKADHKEQQAAGYKGEQKSQS